MNEPPGARMRVGLSALTVAEYFREDLQQDVLLFIDNIFRFYKERLDYVHSSCLCAGGCQGYVGFRVRASVQAVCCRTARWLLRLIMVVHSNSRLGLSWRTQWLGSGYNIRPTSIHEP